jgi:sulfide:quinone oxidoreductase
MTLDVVILGGSFGGLTTAYELRRHLDPSRASVTVISRDPRFVFVPSLPWVAMGSRTVEQISFPLAPALSRRGVRFLHETVLHLDPVARRVVTDVGEHPYDVVVVATGHRSLTEAVDGLGEPPAHSPMSVQEAEHLRGAVARLLEAPGPVVVGAAPGASCIGPLYELAFELDHLLRRRGLRHRVPMTVLTPEPFLGHMGMGGAGGTRHLLENALEERDITCTTSAAITRVAPDHVEVEGAEPVESVLSMVIPALGGVSAMAESSGLANPKGFVPVGQHYRHPDHEEVYAVGVAVAMAPVGATPVPVNFPKTGHMTEQMAEIAAADIAARLGGADAPAAPELSARCIMDMGDRGVYLSVDPVRPPRNRIPRVSEGRRWLAAKRAFERLYLESAKRGRRVPTALGW